MKTTKSDNGIDVKHVPHWGGLLNEFLWMCAGVNRKILLQCPTDWAKYAGTGGLILFTSLMAMLSGGYAFYTIFETASLAIGFGIFWGLLIFNLDRFIVNTMYSDGEYTISKMEILAGLPRIIIAIFIGIVISTPLELKIFEDRINSQIVKDNARRTTETRDMAEADYSRKDNKEKELIALYSDRDSLYAEYQHASKELAEEEAGIASGRVGRGPIWRAKKEYEEKCKKRLDDWDNNNKSRIERINKEIEDLDRRIGKFENDIKDGQESSGFCVRYEAFTNVKAETPSVWWVSLFITLMFIIIEVCPTFFKMMVAAGPYDALLAAEEHEKQVVSKHRISNINDEINTQIQISVEKNKNKLEAEIAANKELLEKIAVTQAELLKTAVEEWRNQELEKIHQDPSAYIKSNTIQSQS
ncbi:MAG: DUF4407 domain-containing protein [Bacteroidales bacterium]|nr:DUF4407 domain-containing protein [Bacteroidales bacterium]